MSSDADPRASLLGPTCPECGAGPAAQEKATAGNWRCLECSVVYTPGET